MNALIPVLAAIGAAALVALPFILWRMWCAGILLKDGCAIPQEHAEDIRHDVEQLQQVLNKTRKPKESKR